MRPGSRLLRKLVSIYPRLLLSILIVITPVYILSLKMNSYGERNVRHEIEDSIRSRVTFYMHLMDTEFSRVIRMQEEYVNDRDLRTLSQADPIISEIERREAIISIHEQLRRMTNTSPYIVNTTAYLPATQRAISSTTQYSVLQPEEYGALKTMRNRYENPFIYWNDRLFISFPYSNVALINGEEPTFVIGVEINQQQVREVLNRFAIGGSGGAMLLNPDGEWSISSDGSEGHVPWTELKPLIERIPADAVSSVQEAELNGERYWFIAERSASHGVMLLSYVPESEILGSLKQYRTWYWALSGLSLFVIALFAYWIFLMIHQPMRRLMRAFQRVEHGNLSTVLEHKRMDEFGYLYIQFNSMVAKMNELIYEVYEQKFRANLSELRQLQSQINPHFLYNSFFNLYRMAKNEENENIAAFSRHLGHYFQFITRTQKDEVPLQDEVNFARNYVEIQTFRFESRIAVRFDPIPEAYRMIRVPKLIIQPLLENAYQHGLRNTMQDGRLEVRFEHVNGNLDVVVEDNGEGMTEPDYQELQRKLKTNSLDVETTGLVNVHRRLQLRYGVSSGLAVVNAPGRFQVRISIPLEEGEVGRGQGGNSTLGETVDD